MDKIGNRITIDPDMLNGKPAIRGQRIAAQTILEFLAAGDSVDEILAEYPSLEREDIYACIQFAANLMSNNFAIVPALA